MKERGSDSIREEKTQINEIIEVIPSLLVIA